jgi:hypothetical protein
LRQSAPVGCAIGLDPILSAAPPTRMRRPGGDVRPDLFRITSISRRGAASEDNSKKIACCRR